MQGRVNWEAIGRVRGWVAEPFGSTISQRTPLGVSFSGNVGRLQGIACGLPGKPNGCKHTQGQHQAMRGGPSVW